MTALATTFAFGFGGNWEWLILLLIVLLLFGRRLPGVARSLGQGISSFKKGLNEPVEEDGEAKQDDAKKDEAKAESSSDA